MTKEFCYVPLTEKTAKVDLRVRFHPIIGLKDDGRRYVIRGLGSICGQQVAWLDGKSGCVALNALSEAPAQLQ